MKKILLALIITGVSSVSFARTSHSFTVENNSDTLINCTQTNNWGNNIQGSFNVITGAPVSISWSQQNGYNASYTKWSCQYDQVGDTVNFEASMSWYNGPEYLTLGRVTDFGAYDDTDTAQPHYCITHTGQTAILTFYNAAESKPTGCTNLAPGILVGGE